MHHDDDDDNDDDDDDLFMLQQHAYYTLKNSHIVIDAHTEQNLLFWEQVGLQVVVVVVVLNVSFELHSQGGTEKTVFHSSGAALKNAQTPDCFWLFSWSTRECEDVTGWKAEDDMQESIGVSVPEGIERRCHSCSCTQQEGFL